MAHLQPSTVPGDGSSGERIRLTSIRGFITDTVALSARQLRDVWQARFAERGPDHGFWLYTHIPFCPQICSFCQCSTGLKKSDRQIADYIAWLEGEIDFFAEAFSSGLVKFQYVGGGTANILSEAQLEQVLGRLNARFRFDPASRRTFEFLPSALRPDTLAVVRGQGFTRLSCGVQSWNPDTLKAVNRSHVGLEQLGRTIDHAYGLGYDEFNVDLVYGIGGETDRQFLDGLRSVLELRPTTVTIHNVIPTATNPVYATVEDELAAHARFENLEQSIGAAVAERFPGMVWVLRPNSWILVDRAFHAGPSFSLWYYSDNERIHIDMLGLGRFAHSNVLGRMIYENLSQATRFDPDEPSYRTFRKSPAIDAALDLITDLVGDRGSDLDPIRGRYGDEGLRLLAPALERLRSEGVVANRDGRWDALASDGVFIDPYLPLLDAALQGVPPPWAVPSGKIAEQGVAVGAGDQSLMVFIEKAAPDKRYFSEVGRFGVYYRQAKRGASGEPWVDDLMREVLAELRQLLDQSPTITAKQATALLRQRLR